jgi:uncharacterized cupredoxin-like copper-binding protein
MRYIATAMRNLRRHSIIAARTAARTNLLAVLALAIMAALLVACSGGGGGSATPTIAPGSPTAVPPTPVPTQPATPYVLQQPDATVAVALVDYSVTPDKTSVKAGVIRFIATNAAQQVHQLVVLRRGADGSLEKVDEIPAIDPGKGATLSLHLSPGSYVLACLIAKGENGSAVDHYQSGMHTDFTVQ